MSFCSLKRGLVDCIRLGTMRELLLRGSVSVSTGFYEMDILG